MILSYFLHVISNPKWYKMHRSTGYYNLSGIGGIMFTFGLSKPFPWKDGIAPDASNDIADLYIEEHFTKELKTHDGKLIASMKNWYVALLKFSDGEVTWIISDGKGVLEATKSFETLCFIIDKWKFIERSQ